MLWSEPSGCCKRPGGSLIVGWLLRGFKLTPQLAVSQVEQHSRKRCDRPVGDVAANLELFDWLGHHSDRYRVRGGGSELDGVRRGLRGGWLRLPERLRRCGRHRRG